MSSVNRRRFAKDATANVRFECVGDGTYLRHKFTAATNAACNLTGGGGSAPTASVSAPASIGRCFPPDKLKGWTMTASYCGAVGPALAFNVSAVDYGPFARFEAGWSVDQSRSFIHSLSTQGLTRVVTFRTYVLYAVVRSGCSRVRQTF